MVRLFPIYARTLDISVCFINLIYIFLLHFHTMFISQLCTVESSSQSSTIAQNKSLIIISRWTMRCTVFIYHNDLSKSHFITLLTSRQYILGIISYRHLPVYYS